MLKDEGRERGIPMEWKSRKCTLTCVPKGAAALRHLISATSL